MTYIKDPGLFFIPSLNFDQHINTIVEKTLNVLGFIETSASASWLHTFRSELKSNNL